MPGWCSAGWRVLTSRQEIATTCDSILVFPRSLALIV